MRCTIALILAAAGCAPNVWKGADLSTGVAVQVERQPMPAGHTFSGKYQSTHMGKPLELTQSGAAVTGTWVRPKPPDDTCTVSGTLSGTAKANLLEFTWEEDFAACGEGTVHGAGWALYRILPGRDERPRLYGMRGLRTSDDDQGAWQAIKMTETSTGG